MPGFSNEGLQGFEVKWYRTTMEENMRVTGKGSESLGIIQEKGKPGY